MPRQVSEHFESWVEVAFIGSKRKKWISLFFVVIWALWNLRNRVIFDNETTNMEVLIAHIKCWCHSWSTLRCLDGRKNLAWLENGNGNSKVLCSKHGLVSRPLCEAAI